MSPLRSGQSVLDEAVARYVTRVHRMGAGERFVAFDPEAATEADVEITGTGRDVAVTISEIRPSESVAPGGLVLLQGIGKADKPEDVVRAATALGVAHVVFVETRRAVVHVGDRAESRRRRWHAVAVEAARQCGRGDVPRTSGPLPLAGAVALAPPMRRVYLSPRAESGLAVVLRGHRAGAPLAVFIGPEGGLDDEEESFLVASGFVPAALGRFVLRTEIAAVAVLGAIAALSDDDGAAER
ncbi:MAG TPA: RsmE family RNA methyltransferase [Polyangiaceae bacterium]|nr:RsmE family RNA methyltransferase [Polyangiaceae bacterium]